MRVHLLHPDGIPSPELPDRDDLELDLRLATVVDAAAAGDAVVAQAVRDALMRPLRTPDEICYRHAVLTDFLSDAAFLSALYELATRALSEEREARRWWWLLSDRPEMRLRDAVSALELLTRFLHELRGLCDEHANRMQSEGLRVFVTMALTDLSEEYLAEVHAQLRRLRFPSGVPLTVGLGVGNTLIDYQVQRPAGRRRSLLERLPIHARDTHTIVLPPRDEAGLNAVAAMRDFALNDLAASVGQSAEHVLGFLRRLRDETAFYVGAANLGRELRARGVAVCLPDPQDGPDDILRFTGLVDAALALRTDTPPVSNDLDADGCDLVMVTGANSGGKSTFLRSVGVAVLLAQAGLVVPAQTFALTPSRFLATHFKREEDASLTSGKLDEELARMSRVVEHLESGGLVLFNESFASTYEHEGAQIARDIVLALTQRRVRVVFVTHMFELGRSMRELDSPSHRFLRAAIGPDGRPTFALTPGDPLPRSNGVELYDRVFAERGTTAQNLLSRGDKGLESLSDAGTEGA